MPTGQLSLHEEADRLELTIAGVLFGQYRTTFDRRLRVVERDSRAVCALGQISGAERHPDGDPKSPSRCPSTGSDAG